MPQNCKKSQEFHILRVTFTLFKNMSFLAEVLSAANVTELCMVRMRMPELGLNIENLKKEAVEYLENIYVKHRVRPRENRIFLERCEEIRKEIKVLKKHAEAQLQSTYIASLDNYSYQLSFVTRICNINHQLLLFSNFLELKCFSKCVTVICELETMLEQSICDEYIELVDELKIFVTTKKTDLSKVLKEVFCNNITTKMKGDTAVLMIRKSPVDLEEMLLEMGYNESQVQPLHHLTETLWEQFLVPTVKHKVNINIDEGQFDYFKLSVVINSSENPNHLEVFSNLKSIFTFLKDHFDWKIKDELTTLKYIGTFIRNDFSECIKNDCLGYTIPIKAEGLQNYQTVIEEAEKLESMLKSYNMFPENTISLFESAVNVEVLLNNKKRQEYLLVSEQIMKEDLHITEQVELPPESLEIATSSDTITCQVSKSAIDLIQLIENIIRESQVGAVSTVKSILARYSLLVPEYHKQALQSLPLHAGLFHNNCLYISHKLSRWNGIEKPPTIDIDQFAAEIHQVDLTRTELLVHTIQAQIGQLIEAMRMSELDTLVLEDAQPVTEKRLKKCIGRLELIKLAWQRVLPFPLYNRTMGAILDALCSFIVNSVVKIESISSKASDRLVETLEIMTRKGPELFSEPSEVSVICPSWCKFKELLRLLGANLQEISHGWDDSKGALTLYFNPGEVKSLVMARFPHDERRAAVLSKIVSE